MDETPDKNAWKPPELKPGRYFWIMMAVSLLAVGALAYAQYRTVDRARRGKAERDPALVDSAKLLPIMGAVPDFSLTERSDRAVSLDDFRGRVWVADFVFTQCGGPCPIMTNRMKELQDALAEAGLDDVRCVSFSVDPTRDTPEMLREYADQHGADPDRWWFLTGDKQTIYDLTLHGFKLALQDETTSDPIIHSSLFVLVDAETRIRGYYHALTTEEGLDTTGVFGKPMPPDVKRQLLDDIRSLVAEAGR